MDQRYPLQDVFKPQLVLKRDYFALKFIGLDKNKESSAEIIVFYLDIADGKVTRAK